MWRRPLKPSPIPPGQQGQSRDRASVLQQVVERPFGAKVLERRRSQVGKVANHQPPVVGKRVPGKMRDSPYQKRKQDQQEPRSGSPAKARGKAGESLLMIRWSQADERPLHHLVKNPKHRETHGQAKQKHPFEAVTEMPFGRQVEKVAKVGRQAAHYQRGQNQPSSQGHDSSGMGEREGQIIW